MYPGNREKKTLKKLSEARQWWHAPLIPALRRQRQEISEFEASLVYRASARTGSKATQRNSVSKSKKQRTSA